MIVFLSRSGELSGEYEDKKKAMQLAQEETNFSYHKKRVGSLKFVEH